MPKLNIEKPLPGEEALVLNRPYVILTAEKFVSEVEEYEGVRVTLNGGNGEMIAIPLWLSSPVSLNSKLGAFISLLGDDTDDWLGKIIVFKQWVKKNRAIELAPEKKSK